MPKIQMFADGADLDTIRAATENPLVSGFTTNPTLMRKAGVEDFAEFSKAAAKLVAPRPISIEVLADDFESMARQAREIASWGPNVYVKIPITNTKGESSAPVIRDLARDGIRTNVTAIFTIRQVATAAEAVADGPPSVISVFAGRIADAGVDPIPVMAASRALLDEIAPTAELLWASPREVLNIVQAEQVGCDIITMTADLWAKLDSLGKNLTVFSQETVQMFFDDAKGAGFSL